MKAINLVKNQSNQLVFLGVLLFFLGLVVGLIVPKFANPRMGLSSHMEGVMNGMFLIILGLIWNRLALSSKWLKITFWLSLYGTFMNWLALLIAAVFNGGKMLTVAANGQQGAVALEGFITFALITLSLAMLGLCVTVLVGLYKNINMQ